MVCRRPIGPNFEGDIPLEEVAGVLFTRPRMPTPESISYARLDLTTGERLIGFLAEVSAGSVGVSVPSLGAAAMPWKNVHHVELAGQRVPVFDYYHSTCTKNKQHTMHHRATHASQSEAGWLVGWFV